MPKTCYMCSSPSSSREHVPPKAFFPNRGAGLQLATVPSCAIHNNAKSGDDMYLLAHICMAAAKGENLASQVFMRSVKAQIERRENFKSLLNDGSRPAGDEAVAYKVDVSRFDSFFDHLSAAMYHLRFGRTYDFATRHMNHVYLSLLTEDPEERKRIGFIEVQMKPLLYHFRLNVAEYEADRIDEIVYRHQFAAPAGEHGSVTIIHSFYGVFEVCSLLPSMAAMSLGARA